MQKVIETKIHYWGTPVVLISTLNEDGTVNLAPMSSAWWLNQSCMLGMSSRSQTVQNLLRMGECVLNLPSADLVDAVDRLALYTGRNPVPETKAQQGYQYEPNKFGIAGLTQAKSDLVKPPRVSECEVQLEAKVVHVQPFSQPDATVAIEVNIIRTHVNEELLMAGGEKNYIDADKWSPLIMKFCEFHGVAGKLHPSRLATVFASSSK